MIIESVELKDYRNYEYLKLELDPNVNLLYGDNAQGKTNILEALFAAATTKSHRGAKDREMIRIGCEDSHIKLAIQKNQMHYRIDMHLKKNSSKGIAVNGIPVKRAVELFGFLNIVFFSPEDLDIIKDGPAERRRFMDMELSQIDKIYLQNLIRYNKILASRNRLLKDMIFRERKEDLETLTILDMQLCEYGSYILHAREEFIGKIEKITREIHAGISGGKENLQIIYHPCASEKELAGAIAESREKDLRYHVTNVGPHKDDMIFFINEKEVRHYGSQGQTRTAALSLKLAEIELVKEIIHDQPVLLLDDVLSELDSSRQNYLLNSIGDIQTIVTCTGMDEFIANRISINKIFQVTNGKVTGQN